MAGLIKRNCFIGEIYIQSIMLAMSPVVSPLGFLIHYAKDLKTLWSLSLRTADSLKRASFHAGRFLSNKVFAGIKERKGREREREGDKTISFSSSTD